MSNKISVNIKINYKVNVSLLDCIKSRLIGIHPLEKYLEYITSDLEIDTTYDGVSNVICNKCGKSNVSILGKVNCEQCGNYMGYWRFMECD